MRARFSARRGKRSRARLPQVEIPAGTSTSFGRTSSGTTDTVGDYVAAPHGGTFVGGSCNSTACPSGSGAYDSVDVRLPIRVPTNAKSFSYDLRFFSQEIPTYQCTTFNDQFLSLLGSSSAAVPADRNVAVDGGKPISIDNVTLLNCSSNSCGSCPGGTTALAGTGLPAGTDWITVTGPVVPGEVVTLDTMIFDVQDGTNNSVVLLDNFRWNQVDPPAPPTE